MSAARAAIGVAPGPDFYAPREEFVGPSALLALAVHVVLAVGLVLGVHWPTDVMVAACVGTAIPLAFGLVLEARERSRERARQGVHAVSIHGGR